MLIVSDSEYAKAIDAKIHAPKYLGAAEQKVAMKPPGAVNASVVSMANVQMDFCVHRMVYAWMPVNARLPPIVVLTGIVEKYSAAVLMDPPALIMRIAEATESVVVLDAALNPSTV